MQHHLETLPLELLDAVITELPLSDICNLRLTSHQVAVDVARTAAYRSYFNTKTVTLSKECLKTFAQVTEQAWLSSALQQLTIIGLVPGDRIPASDTQDLEIQNLLKRAFSNLADHFSKLRPRSLTLDVKCEAGPDIDFFRGLEIWHAIYKCAGCTLCTVLQAVKESKLRFERLDLFSTTDRCAPSSTQFRYLMECLDMSSIKALAISVSPNDSDSEPGLAQGMLDLLSAARSLEHLSLRWLDLYVPNMPLSKLVDFSFFETIASLPIPHLRTVCLRGIRTTETAILTFLTRHPQLSDLVLEEIHLTEGQYAAIFAHIDQEMTALDSLYLNDLWETRLIQFLGVKGKPHFPSLRSTAPTWMRRSRDDRLKKQAIRYRVKMDRPLGSAALRAWRRKRALQYGLITPRHI